MKVFIIPTGLHSRAMLRVMEALRQYAPPEIEFVGKPQDADVRIAHVIAPFSLNEIKSKEFVVIQYCIDSASKTDWTPIWNKARFVWSYYDLHDKIGKTPFYFAPLGVDGSTFKILEPSPLRNAVMTSGFVTGPGAEPIEEMGKAAEILEMPILHLGPPNIQGMKYYPRRRRVFLGIEDSELVEIYNQAKWVSGMRHIEGFELPVIEGLACGARPICFDRSDMRQWYNGHAVFVPECHGQELQNILVNVMSVKPNPVSNDERMQVLDNFSWSGIARGFWQHMNV